MIYDCRGIYLCIPVPKRTACASQYMLHAATRTVSVCSDAPRVRVHMSTCTGAPGARMCTCMCAYVPAGLCLLGDHVCFPINSPGVHTRYSRCTRPCVRMYLYDKDAHRSRYCRCVPTRRGSAVPDVYVGLYVGARTRVNRGE